MDGLICQEEVDRVRDEDVGVMDKACDPSDLVMGQRAVPARSSLRMSVKT